VGGGIELKINVAISVASTLLLYTELLITTYLVLEHRPVVVAALQVEVEMIGKQEESSTQHCIFHLLSLKKHHQDTRCLLLPVHYESVR
jgi:hypothetical protein